MRKFQQLRRFVLALSGADEEVLELVPSERARFESLGWAILITSGMAVISMWFALSSALGVNGILAVPVALFWGLVIMGIDRWLITSMPIDGGRKFAMAVPRVLLAILLGTLISTPLVLRVFQSEIDAQMAKMQQQSYNTFLQEQQSSQVDQQVTAYGQELNQLNTVIASHGTQTGNTAADPQLVAYNKQLVTLDGQLSGWEKLKAQYYQDYTCQKYGGADCPKKGVGPAAEAAYASYQQASGQVTRTQGEINTVQGEIQQRDQQLTSTSKAAQQIRYQQALVAQPVVQGEYNTAVQRRNQLQASFYAQEQAAHGILMRLEALSQLSNGNLTVTGARFLLFLLFLVIECLPVTVKLLQRPGQYEAALEEAKNAERRDFKKAFATRSRFGPGGFTNGRFQNGSFPNGQGGPAILQLEPEPEPSVGPIWNGGTRPLPITAGDYEDRRPTERLQNPGHVDGGRGFDYGSPADHSRQQRRWHGADEYRNYWGQRDWEEPPREAPRPSEPARDPYVAPTRQDPLAAQTRQDYGYAGQAARGDGYRPDSDAAAPYRDEDRPVYDAASEPEQEPVPAQSDGNGSGIPLNWDDE